MGLRHECVPVVEIKQSGGGTNYIVDTTVVVKLRVLDINKGKVTCPAMSEDGRCKGLFPCYVNEADMYTTVVPESNQ